MAKTEKPAKSGAKEAKESIKGGKKGTTGEKKGKGKWIVLGIVILLILIIGGGILSLLLPDSTPLAVLHIESGDVQVQPEGGSWRSAVDGEELDQGDKVKTLAGYATLILYGNLLTQLDENTEVAITELVDEDIVVDQASGSTWNTFLHFVKGQKATVRNPRVAALVRGTSFGVFKDRLVVGEGTVVGTLDGVDEDVPEGYKLVILEDGSIGLLELGADDQADAIARMQRAIDMLVELRQEWLDSHPILVGVGLKVGGITEAELPAKLEEADSGQLDYNGMIEDSGFPTTKFSHPIIYTDMIVELRARINEMG